MTPQINLLIKRTRSSFSRKILAVAFAATIFTTSAFASGEEDKAKAINNLKKEFSSAKDIQWKLTDNYIKASFTWNGQQLEAFYNYDGEMIAKSRHIDPVSLPIDAQQTIAKKYAGYKFDETVEYNAEEGQHYFYTSLIKENTKIILEITPEGYVSVYQK
ncbi:MAG: hypothetical protein ABI861_08280 [Panacibacter sp.]